ncbi:secretory pathway Sec39 [Thozetella sp. PMI_491]|nr:secretory pathway Sec39 [Thozetella sp. PMI_491]
MALVLSAPKTVLLAVQLATAADIDSLAFLIARHPAVLQKELVLRILLTFLPETLDPRQYTDFVAALKDGKWDEIETRDVDCSAVEVLTEEEAAKKVRKLHLLPITRPDALEDEGEDPTILFLLQRACRVDEEAGLLDIIPALLTPFLHEHTIRDLLVSEVLPLLRRNLEYYPSEPLPFTLSGFQRLPAHLAVDALLSQTGAGQENISLVGRDLKGLIGPWLLSDKRWTTRKGRGRAERDSISSPTDATCPGWERVLEWLTTQAVKSWRVAASAVQQWDGPVEDVDHGGWASATLTDAEQAYLKTSYARAAIASAYLVPEASKEALEASFSIAERAAELLNLDPCAALLTTASILPPFSDEGENTLLSARNATYLRNDLLANTNTLTTPNKASINLLRSLVLSAFLLTRDGAACTVRRAGELALLQDEREQKAEATKLIHAISSKGHKSDDKYWIKARNEILWLRDWGDDDDEASSSQQGKGVFGQLKKEFLEVEILKALLANTRYTLAKNLYEDTPDQPLPKKTLQGTIFTAAMHAYDSASNPNRTRGGVKKCDDIIRAFPKTMEKSLPATKKTEALIRATHGLSEYRLVLKQGEPFTPVVLRVHTDPISIVEKILKQNSKSYTRIQELLDLGANMVQAGLTVRDRDGHSVLKPEQIPEQLTLAERRITAMCIDAALTEDDFETAYSYVVNRLSAIDTKNGTVCADDYSWKAALQAGTYRRTSTTLRPTHLGTTSGNPEIRHLEQRIECLATALRIAPPVTLQQILNAFRRAEEELDSAVKAEAEQENAWDDAADTIHDIPGGFGRPAPRAAPTVASAVRSAAIGSSASSRHQPEEAPMSLFDLSRASIISAQRNITALSNLQRTGIGRGGAAPSSPSSMAEISEDGQPKRVRKRDQLREAAMGTLVSGVGWLINAPAPSADRDDSE